MPTTFHMAAEEERRLIDHALLSWHKELAEAGVQVGVIFAHNADGPAISHGGYPAEAKIKPLSLKERVAKNYDAEMLIDETHWEGLTDQARLALADHELSHIKPVPKTKKELEEEPSPWWRTDDIGRPKLTSIKGDWMAGDGFSSVVARHGENASEYSNLRTCWSLADQACGKVEEPSA